MFPKNDPQLLFHEEVQEKFAHHQDYLILGIEHHENIYQGVFLQQLDSLVKTLEQHELVKEVNAPTNLRYYFRTPFGIQSLPFLHPHQADRYQEDARFLANHPDVKPKFVSRNNTAICAFIFLHEALNDTTKNELRTFLDQNVTDLGFATHHIYADVYAKDAYLQELETEMYWLAGIAIFLILGILLRCFRSLTGIILPIFIVLLTIIWTLGTIALCGVSINMMTVLTPTIVGIISLSDVVHVINRYNDHHQMPKEEAIQSAYREMRTAILLTSLTTGLGFATLAYSNLQPFIEFGLFTSIGVAYAYLFAVFLLPTLLKVLPKKGLVWKEKSSDHFLAGTYNFVQQKPKLVMGSTLLLILFSLAGMSKLKMDAYLYEELSAKDEFSKTLQFFEEHFSGIRTFTLHLSVKDDSASILDFEILQQIDQLEGYLLNTYGLRGVYTISTQIKRANRLHQKGDPVAFRLPNDAELANYLGQQVLNNKSELGLQSILTKNKKETRITGKMPDLGSAIVREKNQHLKNYIASELSPDILDIQLTGSNFLLDKSNKIITYKLLYGLLFAVVVVSLLMGWMYRSIRITLLAILPNLLPLLLILGVMGWANMGLKMSTVIVFTIAFGISVDDTIHFMSRLRRELQQGQSLNTAIKATFFSTGKAIIITSLILILGFSVLLLSSFQTTFITGLLVSLALLFALFADLFLLPVLLALFYKKA